ncbi:E3 ubiquitin-protein ligase [Dirofilaria immitis]|nr:E3 ubiquitin-protein ligase [Dirofilaria immitis]
MEFVMKIPYRKNISANKPFLMPNILPIKLLSNSGRSVRSASTKIRQKEEGRAKYSEQWAHEPDITVFEKRGVRRTVRSVMKTVRSVIKTVRSVMELVFRCRLIFFANCLVKRCHHYFGLLKYYRTGIDENSDGTCWCCRTPAHRRRQERNIHPTLEAAVTEFRRAFSGGTESEESQCSASGDRPLALRRFGDDRTCPICFAQASFAVVTNCGHLFCCEFVCFADSPYYRDSESVIINRNCIYGYWQYSASLITPVKCAVCREIVNLLIPLPTESERENSADEALRCNERLTDYNRRFSNDARPVNYRLYSGFACISSIYVPCHSFSQWLDVYVPDSCFLVSFGMAVYILSPFDILPEAVFGILGMVDDIFIVFVVLVYATILFRQLLAGGRLRFGDIASGRNGEREQERDIQVE